MSDQKKDIDLDAVLKSDAPAPDENARKRALNLAMAEFDQAKNEKSEKKSQGIPFFSRLMGNTNPNRRENMSISKKKLAYGGFATAFVAVIAAGITLNMTGTNVSDLAQMTQTESQTIAGQPPQPENLANKSILGLAADGIAAGSMATARSPAPASMRTMELSAERQGFAPSGAVMMDEAGPSYYQDIGRDQFEDFEQNQIKLVAEEPVSTFSVDVDTASYSFVRKMLGQGVLPQKDAVRIEEMINYFDYDYTLPESKDKPFEPNVTVTPSPWKDGNKLVHIGIKGFDIAPDEVPDSNLVFLLDVSGSMNAPDKLPLVKQSLKMLLDQMDGDDTISIVVYAGAAGTVLEPTPASEKQKIIAALDNLSPGGSTAGAEGIRQAYALAESVFDENKVNRVILATDGDFNVGITNREELQDFVERKRQSGIYLSVFGFGQGNYNDHMMQVLAQNGNGVAAYIDNLNEARKVLVEEATSSLFPIAQDVKIQVEFNPETVDEYRLIGYETRALNREDFDNDQVDAGDIGAGHTVTAIYEITPVGSDSGMIGDSRYGAAAAETETATADTDFGDEYGFLKIRYKLPGEDESKLITTPIKREEDSVADVADVAWATAVAGFGQLLKGGKHTGDFSYDDVLELAQPARGNDAFGYRAEFIQLVRAAKTAAAMQEN